MHIIILILNLAAMVLAYDLQCPDRSQRQLRSQGLCVGNSTYTCLEDDNIHTFNESCSEVEATVRAGRKYVYKGQTTDVECSKHRYQPIKFYKTSAAVCLFLKSLCAEVGQIVARNGSSINDTTCICDNGEGYTYVTRPADVCSCVPSREDCTCYEKKCPKDHILSADSKCIYRNTPNVTVCATDNKSGKSATTTVRTDFTALNNTPVRKQIRTEELYIICRIVITVLLPVLRVSFWLIIFICRCNGYCVKAKSDEQDTSSFRREINEQREHREQEKLETTAQIKICSCHDSHENTIREWEEQDKVFVKTHVVDDILNKLESNHCITVTGKPGMGKSAIIHHIALSLRGSQGYTIVPCTNPRDIRSHYKTDCLQVFVFDNVGGKCTVNQNEVNEWKQEEQTIITNLKYDKTKILSSCRLQVFREKQFKDIPLFKICSIDLTSNQHSLTTKEKIDIALKYLDKDTVDTCKDILEKSEFLPLTCYLCQQNSTVKVNVQDFLSNPFHFYTDELNQIRDEFNNTKWCALFLCILHDGKIEESYFGLDHNREDLQTIVEICGGGNSKPSVQYFKDQLESLVGTYIKKTKAFVKYLKTFEITFTIIHDKMFDFFCHYFGSNHQEIFIRHAEASVLGERTQLESLNEYHDQFTVIISKKNEDEFFKRSLEVWANGYYISVLCYNQMKFKKFRNMLINKIKTTTVADLRMSCHDLESALHIVCKAGYHDMFCFLLEQQSVFNHNKVLQSACFGGNVDIVRDLINKGAQVNATSTEVFSSSPLLEACKGGNTSIVDFLIENGAVVNQIDYLYSPLILACESGNESIVTLLIKKAADVNLTAEWYSPLISACREGHLPIVKLLIDERADVNKKTVLYSPLIAACEGGNEEIVKLLIDKGANVDQKIYSRSPLLAAVAGGNKSIVSLLIDNGADVNQTTDNSSTLTSAYRLGNESIISLLIEKGADVQKILISACELGIESLVTLLIENKYDVNQTIDLSSALISACDSGNLPIVTLLIEKGADVNCITDDMESPLTLACEGGHLPIVTLLIEKGADVNGKEGMRSPLNYACESGHLPIVSLLIDNGANVNVTKGTSSPLIIACGEGHLKIVSLLIDKGADLNFKNSFNRTALDYANTRSENQEVVNLLTRKVLNHRLT